MSVIPVAMASMNFAQAQSAKYSVLMATIGDMLSEGSITEVVHTVLHSFHYFMTLAILYNMHV